MNLAETRKYFSTRLELGFILHNGYAYEQYGLPLVPI